MSKYSIKIIICTVFALLAFAGNSVLCRMALGENTIDAAKIKAFFAAHPESKDFN